jgi:predicted ATPase
VSPNLYLPERFKTSTTKLDDGTILVTEGKVVLEGKQQQQVIEVELTAPEQVGEERQVKLVQQQAQVVAEKVQKAQKVEKKKKNAGKKGKEDKKSKEEEEGGEAVKHPWAVEHPDPLVKTEKPISRAERRRLIKEEIRRLSQTDKPLYYQRRLW